MTDFRVNLDVFRGPLDLLLYLVRKHEVEISDLPITPIAEQFLDYLAALQELDVNRAGDFVELASTLMEIKSRLVLPRGEEEDLAIDDPKQELVRRLLEYKKYKDAASMLEERSVAWQEQFSRLANDFPVRERSLAEEPLREVELWDLVSAFGRVIRENVATRQSNIVYDETPIHVYMQRIHGRLLAEGRLAWGQLLNPAMHKSTLVGLFLAILELVRHHQTRVEQPDLFGEIWLVAGDNLTPSLNLSQVDGYDRSLHAGETHTPAPTDRPPST